MTNTRTNNSIKNVIYSFINQGIVTILTFITRTILINKLGNEYLGINGLFTNIISMLSLAELGIGLAIPFSLYKPLAEKDENKINALMHFYSKVYFAIGSVVLVVGVSLTPFLKLLVKEMPDISSIRLIYIIYVINSAITYFFAYKFTIITADQKAYVIAKVNNYSSIILAIAQCLALAMTKNYILYLLCATVIAIYKNLYISHMCDKQYPYIKKKCTEKLSSRDLAEIKKNILAVCIYKIGSVILTGTNGIIISKFIGIVENGLFSNYTMIINAISSILSQVSNGLVASVGNLVATSEEDYSHNIFNKLDFMNYWLYGVCSICIYILINPFIYVWIGDSYRFSTLAVWAITMNFYVLGMQSIVSTFRNTYGLFWKGKFRPIIMAIINLTLGLYLVRYIGVFGVILASLISRISTTAWYDPYIVFNNGFNRSPKTYYCDYIKRVLTLTIVGQCIKAVLSFMIVNSWIMLIVKAIVVFIITNTVYLIIYRKKEEFIYFKNKFAFILKKE